MSKIFLLGLPGCTTCKEIKKITKGKIKYVSVSTKKGYKIATEIKTNRYPQCFTKGKNGKYKKCNTKKFLKKYGIKIT